MSTEIPASHADLFDRKSFAHLACHLRDGSILVNPVWFKRDGDLITINSAQGRLKDRAMRRNPQVTLCISDPDDPYRYLEIRGTVEEITTADADREVDQLAKKYLGLDEYPHRKPGEVRVSYRIRANKAIAFPA